jgi:hypothetical protein
MEARLDGEVESIYRPPSYGAQSSEAPGPVLVTIGAGDIFKLGEALVDGGGP